MSVILPVLLAWLVLWAIAGFGSEPKPSEFDRDIYVDDDAERAKRYAAAIEAWKARRRGLPVARSKSPS